MDTMTKKDFINENNIAIIQKLMNINNGYTGVLCPYFIMDYECGDFSKSFLDEVFKFLNKKIA